MTDANPINWANFAPHTEYAPGLINKLRFDARDGKPISIGGGHSAQFTQG
jgi:hypothetical protein